jgi:ribosome-binding factor A
MTRRAQQHSHRYPRTARLNELVREIVADELERIDDGRLELVAITTVTVEPDMRHATVLFDSLTGEETDDEVLTALREHRVRLQRAIAEQARMKRTPELAFRPDEVVRRADRVEEILRDLPPPHASPEDG